MLAGEALKGNSQDGGFGHGGWPQQQWPPMAPPAGQILQTSTIQTHFWGDGAGAVDPLFNNRLAPGGQSAPSAGHLFTAHQGAGIAGWWNEFPNQPAFGGVAQRSGYPPQPPGTCHHPEGTQPGSQGFWWGPLPAAPDWERQVRPPGRPTHLQREGDEGKRQEQVRRKEKRGEQEGWIRPSSIALDEAGGGSPESGEQRGVTMREFFPNYHGPLSHKNVLFCRAEPLETSKETAVATSAGPAPRGDFSNREATSASSEKVPPLGLRLGLMGGLLRDRFLEVLLHSQPSGKGKPTSFFPLPTSRDRIFSFFCTASPAEVDWFLAICLALNSYWGGPLFNEGLVTKCHQRVLESFLHDIRRLSEITETVDEFDWAEFFRCRTIDYRGEEVKTARSFSWANIGPTLPKEIGIVQLRDVCEQGCQYYVDHFPEFLKPVEDWPHVKNSRVMVRDSDWPEVAANLVKAGVCQVIPESEVFKVRGKPLLNGLFGVEKGEDCSGVPLYRLIMNLVPLNSLCLSLAADIGGLPHWLGMNPFALEPTEGLLVSSEDVRCFFYTLGLPRSWVPFLAFNRTVPESLKLRGCEEPCYLASVVLPMGFLNSVGIAQHVHRVLVSRASPRPQVDLPSREIRKDLPLPETPRAWRVYLDNYDLLEKFPWEVLAVERGSVAPDVEGLRGSYGHVGMPRHTGKTVSRQPLAEVQGAVVDGVRGMAYPKGSKLVKYTVMAILFCQLSHCSQRQAQVICGGLVYFTTFRRQLLGSLNLCWTFIESFNHRGRGRLPIPDLVKLEILRCVCLVGLCRMDFRLPMSERVTCSDASTTGGGMCCSSGLSPVGAMVARGVLRLEGNPLDGRPRVLSIGLFDGVGCLRVAWDVIGANVLGHVSVEKQAEGHRVVEYHFPGSLLLNDVAQINEEDVRGWSLKFGQVDMVLLGAGPPCQGVSGLNAGRKGALLDERSSLFIHVGRVKGLLQKHFPWCPTHVLMESVASMDQTDRALMSESFGDSPWEIDSEYMTWCRRPRLYWITWGLQDGVGVELRDDKAYLTANVDLEDFITPGWSKVDPERAFPTFTTSRPRNNPGYRPAGLGHCDPDTVARWTHDKFRYPPYQYLDTNCLRNRQGALRLPNIEEKELIMGLPIGYTLPCMPKSKRKSDAHLDARHTLVGNAWCIPVVGWLLSQLMGPMGLSDQLSPQQIMERLDPSKTLDVRSRLLRTRIRPVVGTTLEEAPPGHLEKLLSRLVSAKGEDILLSSTTDQLSSHQRLRHTVPARLWRWRIIAGWKWKLGQEHINCLEMRALEATIRWRIEKLGDLQCQSNAPD